MVKFGTIAVLRLRNKEIQGNLQNCLCSRPCPRKVCILFARRTKRRSHGSYVAKIKASLCNRLGFLRTSVNTSYLDF